MREAFKLAGSFKDKLIYLVFARVLYLLASRSCGQEDSTAEDAQQDPVSLDIEKPAPDAVGEAVHEVDTTDDPDPEVVEIHDGSLDESQFWTDSQPREEFEDIFLISFRRIN